jgi:hypothetical protein
MSNIKSSTFFLQWVTAVSAALFVGMFAGFLSMWSVGDALESAIGETAALFLAGGLFGALIGAGTGLGQLLPLRNFGLPLGRWLIQTIAAGAIGMAAGMALVLTVVDMETMPQVFAGLLMGLLVGLPVSVAQWQILKGYIAQANLWVPLFTAAFVIAFAVGLSLSGEGREALAIGTVANLTAIISGAGMLVLLRGEETAVAA